MTPLWFLRIGGLLSLGIGMLGIAAPMIFGDILWFDTTENIVHTAFGIGLLLAGSLPSWKPLQRKAVWITAMISLAAGIAGLIVRNVEVPNFLGLTNLEHPVDNMLHLGFGLWALAVTLFAKSDHLKRS